MPALVVASAGKPSEARYFAEPTSNGFGMTKQPGAWCSSAKRARLSSDGRRHGAVLRHEIGKTDFLAPGGVEIVGREPALVSGLARRPLAVEHGEPGGVAVAALDDHVLAEDALEREAEALGRALRGRVEVVALPLVAAIAEIVEDIAREEILRFGRAGRALQRGRVEDIADLDDAVWRVDAQKGLIADRGPGGAVEDREEQRVRRLRLGGDAGLEDGGVRVGAVEQVGPDAVLVAAIRRRRKGRRRASRRRAARA